MTRLRLDLFDRRFDDLVELARARIPNLAPEWTDHNVHDPGIMLIDLLAWTAEAQLYALSRMRRDERQAYGALLGITPHGRLPATGLIWPSFDAAGKPSWDAGTVIRTDAAVHTAKPDAPVFWPTHSILLTAARIVATVTQLSEGCRIDQSAANRRDGAGFDAFGPDAGPADVLELRCRCADGLQLFSGMQTEEGVTPHLSLGVLVDSSTKQRSTSSSTSSSTTSSTTSSAIPSAIPSAAQGSTDGTMAGEPPPPSAMPKQNAARKLRVALVAGERRVALPVVADTTAGFMQTGALVLDLAAVPRTPAWDAFSLKISAPAGFARPPCIRAIELHGLPVVQSRTIRQEMHISNGLPDQVVELEESGLQFDKTAPAVQVKVAHDGTSIAWEFQPNFDASAPNAKHYQLDPATARVTFGNGVNGMIPPLNAQVLVSYATSAGAAGNVPRKQRWSVHGVAGVFGTNLDPMSGGADALDLLEVRREARRLVRQDHALITAQDLAEAALALPGLQVARAEVVSGTGNPATQQSRPVTTLVALRARAHVAASSSTATSSPPPPSPTEPSLWLDSVQAQLSPRLPLGTRLRVIAPRYVRFRLAAHLTALPMEDPARIEADARAMLVERLALTPDSAGDVGWPLGQSVSAIQVAAWLRKVQGVARVVDCQLTADAATTLASEGIAVPPTGLPVLDLAASVVHIERMARRQ